MTHSTHSRRRKRQRRGRSSVSRRLSKAARCAAVAGAFVAALAAQAETTPLIAQAKHQTRELSRFRLPTAQRSTEQPSTAPSDQDHPIALVAAEAHINPTFQRTSLDIHQFQHSISRSLEIMKMLDASATLPRPATELDPQRFSASIQSAVGQRQPQTLRMHAADNLDTSSPPDAPTLDAAAFEFPFTDFDLSRFDRSLKRALPAGEDSSEIPETYGFALPIQAALASSRSASAAIPSSPGAKPFKRKPFDQLTGHPHNYHANDFSPTPVDNNSLHTTEAREAWVYDSKYDVPTQRPWVEWPRRWYGDGITPRGINLFGSKNLVRPQFYVYGDYRTSISSGRNAGGRTDNWAHRLNLDLDLRITDTERFHAFVGPLDNAGNFTRWQLVDGDVQFREEIDLTPATAFFEGDLGVLIGAAHNRTSPFELPFTAGLVPLLFQNGIWMEDAVAGAAFALPARHSNLLNWSNYDATFFAVFDQLDSPAFDSDSDAQALGTAWFIEAYHGYIESGYAYLRDRNDPDRSYHNITASYTRRYFDRISNSVRVIVNTGQDLDKQNRTADGALLLVENSLITPKPLTVVPYANFFVGWDRPQSVARAGGSGGVLRNTGINFDTDGLNGFATLDTTASDTAGGAVGIDLIGDSLDRQLILEAAYLTPHGSKNANVPDDQFAVGSRIQVPVSNATLLRFDVMYGWRRGLEDVYGTRMEYRWKF